MDVIIGAASGMGAAAARRLAGSSQSLLLADVDEEGAQRIADEIGGRTEVRRCDLSDRHDIGSLARSVDELGALVVTAGLSPSMAPGRRIFEVDIIGPALLLEAFAPLARQGSVAVLLASMAGHLAPGQADAVLDRPLDPSFLDHLAATGLDIGDPATAYVYSKRALMRLVRRTAKPWGDRGARVLTVSPGIIDTPMGRRENEAQPVMADMVSGSALGRMIDADEVAAVVEFLVSPAASAMTGIDVLVDGGAVAALTS
jgi:NAD(P)-dependent dehydrogenase (short-subunit alcohol dehydrogenase family)